MSSQNRRHSKYIYLSGQVGITLNINWCQPLNATNADHIQASMTQLQFWGGWFANPIFVNGQYPDVMREKVKGFDSLYI